MKQIKWFTLLIAVSLMLGMVFTGPVCADEGDDPCIAAGTCDEPEPDEGDPDEDMFSEEEGIAVIADGASQSIILENSIDSGGTGVALTAVNGGSITLTVSDEEGTPDIYGVDAGVDITAENAGSAVSVSSYAIDSDAVGLAVAAGEGTEVKVTNEIFIGGNTAVDIINDGGNVTVENGAVDGVVGVSVLSGAGETTVSTEDISANGYGVILDISDVEGLSKVQAPKVTVTVDGEITDFLNEKPSDDDPGFEPDDPIDEIAEKTDAGGSSDDLTPYDEDWWKDFKDDPEVWQEDEDWGTGSDWDGEDDGSEAAFSIENSVGVIVDTDITGAAVDVSVSGLISMAYGNEINAENGSSVKVSAGEDVVTDYGNRIAAGENSTVEFSVGGNVNAGGKAIDTYTDSGTMTVSVSGDIIAADTDDSDYETVGIYTNSEGNGNTNITVMNGIEVTSGEKGYTAYGISAANIGGNVTIDVDKAMTVSGEDAVGIYLLNDPDGSAFGEEEEESEDPEDPESVQHAVDQPPVTKITVNGTVRATGSKGGTGAEILNQNGKTDLAVTGDLTGSEYGLDVSAYGTDRNSSFADILVTETVSGKKGGLLVNEEADSDGTDDDNLSLTAWAVTPSGKGAVALKEDGTANDKVEKNIKYIIKIAEGQEDKIRAVDENGNELPLSHDYPYAKEGEKVYLEALNGYELTEAYNGKNRQVSLPKDENDRLYLDVPKGGAVWLSAEKQPGPQPEPVEPQRPSAFDPFAELVWLNGAELPGTGFSASSVTDLPARPRGFSYGATGMTLQLPDLNVAEPIVIVSEENGGYPIDWLNSSIGMLEQSSLPGEGITVLTGHNHLNTTEAGPFLFIGEMESNDRIIITDADNSMLVYKVYGNYKIASDGFAGITDAVRENSLVLITCEDESVDGGYLNRRVILAEPL